MSVFGFFKKDKARAVSNGAPGNGDDAQEALDRWQQVLALDPDNIDAKIHIANVHSSKGDNAAASALFDELEKAYPDSLVIRTAVARFLSNTNQVMESRAKWQAVFDDDSNNVEALVNIANLDLSQERYQEALATADRINTLFNQDFRCHLVRGRVHHNQQNWEAAADAWRAVLEQKGAHYEAELHLCIALNRMGSFEDVITQLQLSMGNYPNAEALYALKRRTLTKMGKKKEALDLTTQAMERFQGSADWHYEHASLLYGLQRLEDAEIACKAAMERFGDDVRLLTLYARIGQMQLNRSKVA